MAPPGAHVSGISPIVRKTPSESESGEEESVSPPSSEDFPVFQRRTARPPEKAPESEQTWLGSVREKALEEKRAAFSEKTQPIRPQETESEAATAAPAAKKAETKPEGTSKASPAKPPENGPKQKSQPSSW